jgi:hypothetical protein
MQGRLEAGGSALILPAGGVGAGREYEQEREKGSERHRTTLEMHT